MKSPAAKHAVANGTLDLDDSRISPMNRKMKMHDSFVQLFPLYNHGVPSQIKLVATETHLRYKYPKSNDEGRATHKINREYTCKKDFITEYHDAIIRVANMKRIYKA